ncbi:MFS transporter [Paenibacillus harenae]|uniref:MFS transporter n=1 Tax=Paenibacillus harenae TaxID=306543 RepID=UPI00278F8157|nr:MFS transporter [Paenibacillus harenae]MDQ0062816.1 DHA1 family putative efflux transporter-like MFS transporter [Paenibacillus harenae]
MNKFLVYVIALGAFLVGAAELVVSGVVSAIAGDLGVSLALAGQLVTAFSLSFAIGTPFLIALTSRWTRKKVLAGAIAVYIIGSLVAVASFNYETLIVSRIILGASAGVYTVVAISSAAKLVSPNRIGAAIGTIAFGFSAAMALGVPLGVAIADWWGWRAIFLVLGALSLVILFILLRLLPQIEGDAQASFRSQLTVLSNPAISSGLLISLMACVSNAVLLTYIAPFLTDILHMNNVALGGIMLMLGVFGALGSRIGGYGADKWGAGQMIVGSLVLTALALAFVPVFTMAPIVVLVLLALWMSSVFMTAPALNMYFIQQSPRSSNFVLSINLSIIHLGISLGAGAGGAAVNAIDTVLYHPWFASGAALLGLAAAALSLSLRRKRSSRPVAQ